MNTDSVPSLPYKGWRRGCIRGEKDDSCYEIIIASAHGYLRKIWSRGASNELSLMHRDVLIVEDERVTAADLQASVTNLGYNVVANVASGEEAVACAQDLHPDIVVMDVRLRGAMSGVDAGLLICEQWGIPVIYMSAFLDKDVRQQAGASAAGFVPKPFTVKGMKAALESVVPGVGLRFGHGIENM